MTQAPDRKATTVSREALFRQVWETPMSRLARDYGISGNGLAKICDRLRVPYPPRGYWAKKAAGKKVVQFRLPDAEEGTPQAATIVPTPPPVPPPEIPSEIKQKLDAGKERVGAIVVPDRLVRPHPIVAAWLAERDQQRKQARLERDPWLRGMGPPDWTDSERRQHRLLSALFHAAERNGVRVKQLDHFTTFFEVSGERVDFKLREKHRQVRTSKAADEVKRLLPGERSWRQELQPTGVLCFSIENHLPALPRRLWSDTVGQELENQLGDVLAGLLLAGPLLVEQRRRREEEERHRREEEHRRQQAAERKRLDDNRWRRFTELAARWKRADEARRFLSALEQYPAAVECLADGSPIADWLAWARDRLAEYDPMMDGPSGVFEDVLKVTAWTYRD